MATATILNPEPYELTRGGETRPFPEKKRVVTMPSAVMSPTVLGSLPTKKLNARPKRIRLGVIHSPELHLKKAVPVDISRKKGAVIASVFDLQEFGCGETMSDALDDLSKGLAELFFRLEAESDRLGKDLQTLQKKLSQYVARRLKK